MCRKGRFLQRRSQIAKYCVSAVFMCGTQSYYDMGVAMVDRVILVVYILHVWGSLDIQLFFIVHWVIKRRQQRQFALGI